MIKTYAINGYTEYQISLNVNGEVLEALFTGGRVNGYGQRSARYTTRSARMQRALEASHAYKKGVITLEATKMEPHEAAALAAIKAKREQEAEKSKETTSTSAPAAQASSEEAPQGAEGEQSEPLPYRAEAEAEGKAKELSFYNVEDASNYLKETYGVPLSRVRTKAQVEAYAQSQGLTIIWK